MKIKKEMVVVLGIGVLNVLAFQNCDQKQIQKLIQQQQQQVVRIQANPRLQDNSATLINSDIFDNNYLIDQDSESKKYNLKTLFKNQPDKFRQFVMNKNQFPFKTQHGTITNFDPISGGFFYQPDQGFYGEDIISYSEESLVPSSGLPTRNLNETTALTIYPLNITMTVRPELILSVGEKTGLLTESPSIFIKNPILNAEQNAQLTYEVLIESAIQNANAPQGAEPKKEDWHPIQNGERVKGVQLEPNTEYSIKIRNINSDSFSSKVKTASWTSGDSKMSLVLGASPESLLDSPTLTLLNPNLSQSENDLVSFQIQITQFTKEFPQGVLVKNPQGKDVFVISKNGDKLIGMQFSPQNKYKFEVISALISNVDKNIEGEEVSSFWTPAQPPSILRPSNLRLGVLPMFEEVLSKSPTLVWSFNVEKIDPQFPFEVVVYDVTDLKNFKNPPVAASPGNKMIVRNPPLLLKSGNAITDLKFEDGHKYQFKVRGINEYSTSFSDLSPVWTVTYRRDCSERNPMFPLKLGTLCTDGTIYVGQNQNMRFFTTPRVCATAGSANCNGKFLKLNYADSVKYCKDLVYGARDGGPQYNDWHLSTQTEFLNLIKYEVSTRFFTPENNVQSKEFYKNRFLNIFSNGMSVFWLNTEADNKASNVYYVKGGWNLGSGDLKELNSLTCIRAESF
jgi:hypothetical protein